MGKIIAFRTAEKWAREKAYRTLCRLVAAGGISLPKSEDLRAEMEMYGSLRAHQATKDTQT